MYRIIGADQKEYGPVSAEQLRQWIAEGRAGAHSLVRAEGATEWKPLGELPEFAAALGMAPASQAAPQGGSGAPIGLAQDTLARDYDLDIGRCVTNAWDLLKGNFGMIFGGVAIYLLVQGGMSLLAQIPFIGILLSLASLVITGPLTAGVYLFLLKNIRHQPSDIGDVFLGFRVNFGQLVVGYIVISLLTGLAALPGICLMVYPLYQFSHHEAVTAALVLMAGAGFVLALVPAIYLNISWIYALPLIIDRQMEFWPAMGASRTLVGKHWWSVFGLVVVCGLINLVGVIACCVGIFVSLPLSIGALMYAYETIFSGPAIQTT
jgi:uncharacterized membrane protein